MTPAHASATKRSPRIRRVLLAAVIVAIAAIAFLVIAALQTRSHLFSFRDHAAGAKAAAVQKNLPAVESEVQKAAEEAHDARWWTHTPPWRLAGYVPWVGSAFDSIRESSDVVASAADELMPLLPDLAKALPDSASLSDVDPAPLAAVSPRLESAAASADELTTRAGAIDADTPFAVVNTGVQDLQSQVSSLSGTLRMASIASQLLPSMAGLEGPRNYLLAFQTPAETRATGGLLGGYALMHVENGHFDQVDSGPNSALARTNLVVGRDELIDLGPEWNRYYANWYPGGLWQNSNYSPHFPYAAQIWSAVYRAKSGVTVDGVISVDPLALGYILAATGPITLSSGEVITGDNVARITLRDAYARFSDDNTGREAYLDEIQLAVADRLTSAVTTSGMLPALARSIDEGRLQMWSAHPEEQTLIERTPMSGALEETTAPYAKVIVGSGSSSKLDVYLTREISYRAESCADGRRKTFVTLRLTNTAPAVGNLPKYVTDPVIDVPGPPGTNRTNAALYATTGAKLVTMRIDGVPAVVQTLTDRGHPAFGSAMLLKPGQSREVVWELDEPAAPGKAIVSIQPLADVPPVTIDVPECG